MNFAIVRYQEPYYGFFRNLVALLFALAIAIIAIRISKTTLRHR